MKSREHVTWQPVAQTLGVGVIANALRQRYNLSPGGRILLTSKDRAFITGMAATLTAEPGFKDDLEEIADYLRRGVNVIIEEPL